MLFTSFSFVGLVIFTLIIYYIPRLHKFQIQTLIIASFTFYTWNNPILTLLLFFSCSINIITSYSVVHGPASRRRLTATLGVLANLFTLCFFKYSGLIAVTFNSTNSITQILTHIPLPVGISFFTFQGISLMVDAFKDTEANRNTHIPKSLISHSKRVFLFISFFPQLVAGPIVKSHHFLPQIKTKLFRNIQWEKCFKDILIGYFLKMVVADNLKDYTFWISYPQFISKDTTTLIMMIFGYSCQIFADFSGYSLIAIGISRLFGYNLIDNFNFPYIASSFKEFWKRWHISLSSFLQEYLYIPLGGNRKGPIRTYINLIITMILGGLWHGAAWSYAVWGGYHGVLLAVERFFLLNIHINENNSLIKVLRILFVFTMVSFAWLLFKLPDFNHVIQYLSSIKNNTTLPIEVSICTRILIYSTPIVLYHLLYLTKESTFYLMFKKIEFVYYGLMIFLIATNSGTSGTFIYFQF